MFKLQNSYSLTQLNPPTAPLFSRCMHISPLRSPPVQKLKHPDMILFPTFGTNYFVLTSPNRASLHLRKQPVKRAPMKKTQRSRVHQWPTWQRELMNSLGFLESSFSVEIGQTSEKSIFLKICFQEEYTWRNSDFFHLTKIEMIKDHKGVNDRSTQQVFGCSDSGVELSQDRTDSHFHTNWEFAWSSKWEELTNWLPRRQTRYSITGQACHHTVDVNGCISLQI